MIVSRFAPSPTGYLHIGNVRTAILIWLYIKAMGGKYILRIDDTDSERSQQKYINAIKEDLAWLGIIPDAIMQQSTRLGHYEGIIEQLKTNGDLYPCFESAEELEMKRKSLLNQGKPPIYDRQSLALSKQQIASYLAEGVQPHWRFRMLDDEITWQDEVRGKISFLGRNISDPILIREDGSPTYMLPSVIDDIDYNVSHILRGEDHITNTAIQIQIMQRMQADIPVFGHLSLIKNKSEGKISKRKGGFSVRELRKIITLNI